MALLIDHLWQSCLFVVLVWALASMLQRNSALLRLWLWRIAALKFLIPFTVFYALGAWLGFPVRHSAIAPPVTVVRWVDAVMPIATPAQSLAPSSLVLGVEGVAALLLASAVLWLVGRQLRQAKAKHTDEQAMIEADWTAQPASPGFLKTLAVAGSALGLIVAPLGAGALRDRQARQQALAIDTLTLRAAQVTLREASWRFGDRTEMVATADGVSIRKINLQDLVAMVYGIGEFEVFGGALPWLESPHYDVRVRGALHAPAVFDPYSLRQPVTNYLSQQFGVAIRVNGSCQDPCLNQESFTVERLPWTIYDSWAKK